MSAHQNQVRIRIEGEECNQEGHLDGTIEDYELRLSLNLGELTSRDRGERYQVITETFSNAAGKTEQGLVVIVPKGRESLSGSDVNTALVM